MVIVVFKKTLKVSYLDCWLIIILKCADTYHYGFMPKANIECRT